MVRDARNRHADRRPRMGRRARRYRRPARSRPRSMRRPPGSAATTSLLRGVSTAAIGTPRSCPSATNAAIVCSGEQVGDDGVEFSRRAHIAPRSCRTWGRRTARVRRATPSCRAIAAATAGRSGRSRPGNGRSGRCSDFAAGLATVRWTASPRRPPDPRYRRAGRATARPPRSGRSRCNRLGRNVTGDSRRPAPPTRPAPRLLPRRRRMAAAPAFPTSGRCATARWTTRTEPGRSPATTSTGPPCRNR